MAESSAKNTMRDESLTGASSGGTSSSPITSTRICSTSRIDTRRPPASSVMAVTSPAPPVTVDCGDFTCSQSTRTMRSTSPTRNACVLDENSVMISLPPSAVCSMPRQRARPMTGMIAPRRLMIPSTPCGMFGVGVMGFISHTSRTLNTLMPKVSRPPSENSSSSMRLEPASRAFCSTTLSSRSSVVIIFLLPGLAPAAGRIDLRCDGMDHVVRQLGVGYLHRDAFAGDHFFGFLVQHHDADAAVDLVERVRGVERNRRGQSDDADDLVFGDTARDQFPPRC